MINASKLTRLALELNVPAEVFLETAVNLRGLDHQITIGFHEWAQTRLFGSVEQAISAEDSYRRDAIKNLLDETI